MGPHGPRWGGGVLGLIFAAGCVPLASQSPYPFIVYSALLGSLSSDVFERRTSTGSEVFSLLTFLDDIKFVFLSFFTVIEAI